LHRSFFLPPDFWQIKTFVVLVRQVIFRFVYFGTTPSGPGLQQEFVFEHFCGKSKDNNPAGAMGCSPHENLEVPCIEAFRGLKADLLATFPIANTDIAEAALGIKATFLNKKPEAS
jgi:hypothetical protein